MRHYIRTVCVSAVVAAQSAAIAAAQGVCSDVDVCASAVFCSGFEEGSKAIWDDGDGNPDSTNLLMSDGGPCNRSGNHVMRMRVPAGSGGADLLKILPTTHDKLYARWYQQWEPGYDFTALGHGSGLHAGAVSYLGRSGNRPTGSDWFSAWLEPSATAANTGRPQLYTYYRGMYQDCANPTGSCWGDLFPCLSDEGSGYCTKPEHRETVLPPRFVTGRWYCVEMMMDGGTPSATASGAAGALNYWIDDVQYGPWQNLWFRTTSSLKLTTLWLNLWHHGSHSVQGVLLDDVVVSTTRVGCHGSGVPAAPTNLRIVAN